MIMDRLSDLPDGILHEIFSWMPTNEVVRTSVLSKRWNGLWLPSQVLSFLEAERPEGFSEFVNRTLIFRGSGKVKSFRIELCSDMNYSQYLDLWIRYALQNEAEELVLNLDGDNDVLYIVLPEFCYFSSSLTSLTLRQCRVWLTKGVGWTSLKTLVLDDVILEGNAFHQVLSGCPQLESLELLQCMGHDALNIYSNSLKKLVTEDSCVDVVAMKISAPNVESLCMCGDLYKNCLVINLPSLLYATLDFDFDITKDDYDEQARFLEFLESLGHVKNLQLGECCIMLLAVREKKGLSGCPLKCKCLTLNTGLKQEDIPGIVLVLKCSPALETLTLNIISPDFEQGLYKSMKGKSADFCNFAGERYLDSQVDNISCLQLKLRTINITRFVDQNLVLPFIRFMLKEARVLKNMEIKTRYLDPHIPLDSFFNVARELSDMPKLSPNGGVKLHNSDGKVTVIIS